MELTLDIETLPTNDADMIAKFGTEITAPGQYKKKESIDAWLAENRDAAVAEKIAKTSFDGLYGRLACISWAFDDGEIQSTLAIDSEQDALNKFYDAIRDAVKVENAGEHSVDLKFIGQNIVGFDLPFLKHRSIILNTKPQPDILRAMSAKSWDNCIGDTMLMWSSDREKRTSMDKLCKAFGIDGKGDFDGSMVAATWLTDPQKVIDYCKDDVNRTRQMYNRITFKGSE